MKSKFKLLNRGFKKTIALIPGWATDYRIFDSLELRNYNYLLPIEFCPFSFRVNLLKFLDKESLGKISLFGWSMGGFLAIDFALGCPGRIDELILLSIRRTFEPALLKEIEARLRKNKKAYLYKFYRDCFSRSEKATSTWFRANLLKDYLDQMDLDTLLGGLDYLSSAGLRPAPLNGLKVRLIHGRDDKIAPIEEAMEIGNDLPKSKFIPIDGAGHMPFLNSNFKRDIL